MRPGSGIIIIKKGTNDVLCLYLNIKDDKLYDLTKGIIDNGETTYETAIREAWEEGGIKDMTFPWGKDYICIKNITMYMAESDDWPNIVANPVTGIIEHDGWEWHNIDKAVELMPEYLKPFVMWARNKLIGE